MNVVVIAPHMDDEVLGCGGTIAKHAASGDKVYVCFVAHRIYNHQFNHELNEREKAHALAAKKVLGYTDAIFLDLPDEKLDASLQRIIIPLEECIAKIKPEVVYMPFREDNNQDHRAVCDAARVALRPAATSFIKAIHMYEVPSSTEQSPPLPSCAFLPTYYVNIAPFIESKKQALKCYETEQRQFPHPRSLEAVTVLAQKRGTELGFHYAEAFMTIRGKWE
jgi:N-acetylglucosamine malate deacetylase 1